MRKNKKIIAIVMSLILLMSMLAVVLVACSKDDDSDQMADPSELVEIDSSDLARKIVDGAILALTASDNKYVGMDMSASYEWSNGTERVAYDLVGQLTLDLDPDKASTSRDNQLKLELTETRDNVTKTVFGIYYKESMATESQPPLLYVRVGDTKLAIETMSIKDFLQGNDIDIVGGVLGSGDAIVELLDMLLLVFFTDLLATGDGTEAQATFDLNSVISLVGSLIESMNDDSAIDNALADAGIDLTVEDIRAISTELDIVFKFDFVRDELVNIAVDIDVLRDHDIILNNVDGSSIINIKVPRGTIAVKINDLRFLHYEVKVELPSDIAEYDVIGLINMEIDGVANFYKADGSVNNGGKNNTPIEFFLKADFNPFVILEGITESNVSRLGMLHLRAKGEGKPFLEIVFDPIHTGTNYLYVYINTMGGVGQNLTFDLPATIDFLTKTAKTLTAEETPDGDEVGGNILEQIMSQIKISIVEREGQSNVLATIQLDMLRAELEKLLPGGVDLGPLGKLTLGNLVLGKDNTYATMEFTRFRYGTVRRGEYDATATMDKASSSIIKTVTGIKGAKTEYKLGEDFQYGINSDVKVDTIMLNGKKPLLALSAKVIKVAGYDPSKLGEQTVTVTMRDNGLIASIIAGAIGGDMPLPLGVFTVTYKVNVTE